MVECLALLLLQGRGAGQAVTETGVEAVSLVAETSLDTVLGAGGRGAVGRVEVLVGDVFDGASWPVHGRWIGQGACREWKYARNSGKASEEAGGCTHAGDR